MAQRTISGKVMSTENQQPLAGATIAVKGTSKKTLTDGFGVFKIDASENDVLMVSNIGFLNQELLYSRLIQKIFLK